MHRRLVHHEEQERAMNPNSPWKKTIHFPLWQRGTEGDFCFRSTFKSPLAPLFKSGEFLADAHLASNGFPGINKYSLAFLLLTLSSLFPTAQAGELGRLFFTPQQRQQLEFQETSNNNSGENGHRNYIIVNGVVQKHGGSRTVWINGTAQPAEQGNDKTPSAATVAVPGKSQPIHLKVGQRLLLDSAPPEEEK
jgi:hypothetical protein